MTVKEEYEKGLADLISMGHDISLLPKVEFDSEGNIIYSESEKDFLERLEKER